MNKIPLTVFLCTSKDCSKAWRRVCHGSPGKWLKHQVQAAGLPYKLNIVETGCMDRCEQAACLCGFTGSTPAWRRTCVRTRTATASWHPSVRVWKHRTRQ